MAAALALRRGPRSRRPDERAAGLFRRRARRHRGLPCRRGRHAFQQQVWSALGTIPCGTTISYGELARRIGRPDGRARGRPRQRLQPDRRRRALPPRHRRERLADRLRRRPEPQALAARPRRARCRCSPRVREERSAIASPRLRGEGRRRRQACAAGEGEGRSRKKALRRGKGAISGSAPSPPLRFAPLVRPQAEPPPRKRERRIASRCIRHSPFAARRLRHCGAALRPCSMRDLRGSGSRAGCRRGNGRRGGEGAVHACSSAIFARCRRHGGAPAPSRRGWRAPCRAKASAARRSFTVKPRVRARLMKRRSAGRCRRSLDSCCRAAPLAGSPMLS